MYYIGVDVGGTNLVAGVVDEQGTIRNKTGKPVDRSLGAEALSEEIAQLADRIVRIEDGRIVLR